MTNVMIKEVGKVSTGNTPSKSNEDYYNSADIGFVKPDIISDSEITLIEGTNEYVSEVARSKARIVKENTIFVTCIGSIGKIGIVREAELAFNQQINAIEPNEKVLPKYLAYCLLYNKKKLADIANAPVVPIINKTQFENFTINITEDKEEQQKILDVLNKISCLINYRKQQLKDMDNLIKSRFVEMFGDPVINPMGWEMPLIEDVVADEKNALKAGPFGSALKKEFYVEQGYKIYGQEQVIRGDASYGDYYISEDKYKELENCSVKTNDVLISLVGTYGKLLIIPDEYEPGIINPRLMKITFNKEKINTTYFQYFFQSEALKRSLAENTHGGTMDILNLGIVKKIKIAVPPIELQNQFSTFVKQVDKLKFEAQKSLDEMQVLFDSLMQKYFG